MIDLDPRGRLERAIRVAYQRGLVDLTGGNLSVRRAENTAFITRAGAAREHLWQSAWQLVVPIGADEASSESHHHRAIYDARPWVGGILHTHVEQPQPGGTRSEADWSVTRVPQACTTGVWLLWLEGHGLTLVGESIERCLWGLDEMRGGWRRPGAR